MSKKRLKTLAREDCSRYKILVFLAQRVLIYTTSKGGEILLTDS